MGELLMRRYIDPDGEMRIIVAFVDAVLRTDVVDASVNNGHD